MMKIFAIVCAIILVVSLNCAEEEEPFFCHLYGWMKSATDSTGLKDLKLKIWDIDPEDISRSRERTTTTSSADTTAGFFEMDSVVYGTTKMQGSSYVTIVVDSIDNPAYPTQYFQPGIYGSVDTVIIYVSD
jgi:hypothetical protein